MADDADRANDLRDLELAHALAGRELPPDGEGGTHCEECDEMIPEARRALGYRICVDCSALASARRRLEQGR